MLDAPIGLFVVASVAVILSPGQDMVLVLSRGLSHGSLAGLVTAAGVSAGLLGHTLAAVAGLGAVLATSAWAFDALKWIGASWLIWLGLKALFSDRQTLDLHAVGRRSLREAFVAGALSNLANPKITVFYLAFLPQFVPTGTTRPAQWLLGLGLGYALLALLIKLPAGWAAGRAAGWIASHPTSLRWIDRGCGTVLVAMGLRLASTELGGSAA